MRTMLRESKHYSGDYLEVDIFPVRKASTRRNAKAKPSTATQQRLNEKNAARRLTWLIQENFTPSDLYIGLSYPQDVSVTPEQGKRDLRNYLLRVKRAYKKQGLDFKYITTTEIGKRNGRIHHHVICSGDLPRDQIENLWGKYYANSKRLKFYKTGLAGIAYYTCKDNRLSYRSYNCSKNLRRPETRRRDGRISAKKLRELRQDEFNAAEFEALYPGYAFVDADPFNDAYEVDANGEVERAFDFPHLTIRLFRKNSKYIIRDRDRP